MMLKWVVTLLVLFFIGFGIAPSEAADLERTETIQLDLEPEMAFELPFAADLGSGPLLTVEIDRTFDMFGATWTDGDVSALWAQVRDMSGVWGEWFQVPTDDDHGPDTAQGIAGSSAVYVGSATSLRLAFGGDPVQPEVMVLNTQVPIQGGVASTGDQPAGVLEPPPPSWSGPSFVHDRAEWDKSSCRREGAEPSYSTVQALVIHHTAASNSYTAADVPGIIAGHCEFHVNGRGWDDIGYNFLVDRFGGVWEGRTGSKTGSISGAHTAGFNSRTQGIALMGNFESTLPTPANIDGLLEILNWLSGWHSIDPAASVALTAGSGAIGYEEGELVTVPTIVGHLDLRPTSCPGSLFYATLTTLRTQISPVDFGFDPDVVTCDGRIPNIFGTLGNDLLRGTSVADVIVGLGGDDWIFGLEGDDYICGGDGDDTLVGGLGTDFVFGQGGDDVCGGENRSGCESVPSDELFFYREDGLFRYYNVNPDGSLGSPILEGTGYTAGWDSITGVDIDGDGQDEMFFYRDDGLFRYYNVNPDGSLGSPILGGSGYTAGWDSIAGVDLDGDGQDEMFFYRDDGLFRYYDVGSDGVLPLPMLAGTGYTAGWDAITSIDLDADQQDEMFFYRDDGLFRYYDVGSDGVLPLPMLAGTGYTAGWDAITSVDLDGDSQDEIFFYRGDGLFRFYQIASTGHLPSPILAGNGYTTGWNSITAIELGN